MKDLNLERIKKSINITIKNNPILKVKKFEHFNMKRYSRCQPGGSVG